MQDISLKLAVFHGHGFERRSGGFLPLPSTPAMLLNLPFYWPMQGLPTLVLAETQMTLSFALLVVE